MYVPNWCFLHNIFDYLIRYCLFVICLHFVLYFLIRAPIAYQRIGTKLLLGIMFKNEIIMLTVAWRSITAGVRAAIIFYIYQ